MGGWEKRKRGVEGGMRGGCVQKPASEVVEKACVQVEKLNVRLKKKLIEL